MLPGMIEMKAVIIPTGFMAHPLVMRINVGRVRMAWLVAEVSLLRLLAHIRRIVAGGSLGNTVVGGWSARRWRQRWLSAILGMLLCKCRQTDRKQGCQKDIRCTHMLPPFFFAYAETADIWEWPHQVSIST